jgi:hypothetical protein
MGVSVQWANTHDNALLYAAYHHGLLVTGIVGVLMVGLFVRRCRGSGGLADRGLVVVGLLGAAVVDLAYPPVPGINIACIYGMLLGTLLNRELSMPRSRRRLES